jgi:hypothetical protein
MRISATAAIVLLGLAATIWPQAGRAQSDRDFVFDDEDGHLVIRFAGTGHTGLDASQAEEVLNAEFSQMVHDRLRADLLFEAEPADVNWAASMEPQLADHLEHAGPDFSDIYIACRAASCRVVMEQTVRWGIEDHRAVLETVQESLVAFIAARRQHFEPVFMITAYAQETETPHIKAFLRRAGHGQRAGQPAG